MSQQDFLCKKANVWGPEARYFDRCAAGLGMKETENRRLTVADGTCKRDPAKGPAEWETYWLKQFGQPMQRSCNPAKFFPYANTNCPIAFRSHFICNPGMKDYDFCISDYHNLCESHATIRDAFRCEDNAVAPMYNQVGYAEYWSMGTPLGVWGGTCICPDGRAYEVGDEGNMCGSIACHGGTQLNCNHKEGMWSFREVFCNPVEEVSLNNHQYTVDPEVYEWGGECTCPDGQVKMNPTS